MKTGEAMRRTIFSLVSLPLTVFFVWAVGMVGPAAQKSPSQVDFTRDIQPIFQASCYGCHGSEKQASGFRLDNKELAFKGGLFGVAIVPGKAHESPLYRRVAGIGDETPMPAKGKRLTPAQVALIRAWIDQGASWPEEFSGGPAESRKHWAYVKPKRPDAPKVQDPSWVRNPIDSFVLARLEKEGLRPLPEASKETLIRRASLDLIGLPPSLAEIDAFLADRSPDAYEKVVDRLLASPHYGERWARPWLDLVRYADTNGYEKDDRRSIWPYRDWLIEALNKDMPFDQFTIEQIAGDLLPNATLDQRIATGLHRNTMINEEGGVDPEEFRVAAVLDRVDTTATVWLGTTLHCAQCHNHKFDPFSQEEYYRFSAFFNNTEEEVELFAGSERGSRGPNLSLPAPRALAAHRKQVEDQIASLEAELDTPTPQLDAEQLEWEKETKSALVSWFPLDPIRVTSAAGATLTRPNDGSILAGGKNVEHDTYIFTARTGKNGISAVRLEALSDPSLAHKGVGRSPDGSFTLTGFEVEIAPEGTPEGLQPVKFADAVSQHGSSVKRALDEDPASGWSVRGLQQDTQAIFLAEKPFGFEGGTRLTIRLKQESASAQHVIGRFRLAITSGKEPGKSVRIPVGVQTVLNTAREERSPQQEEVLRAYFRSVAPSRNPIRERLAALRSLWSELAAPATMVMKELPEARKTHVLIRGSFLNKGKEVGPGVPAILHPFPKDQPANRLGLARWLVDPENPLVARVTLNRIWMHYFGRGIVETSEDFGVQGHAPTHPDLLDWLATEFVRQKWSLKAMHRLIVTSASYRQSSPVTPERLAQDPDNRLLSRGPRARLEAELIRDNALAISGLLSPKMFGPSVFPLQPEGVWNLVYNDDKWITSLGEDRYRRGVYTFWRRTAPYPAFMTFDAPSRETICTRRVPTNTPLQALTTLNDPAFFDAARGLARRVFREAPGDTKSAVIHAFRLCTARCPDEKELERLVKLFDQELEHFNGDAKAAKDVALGGGVKPPKDSDIARFAAWTIVANVLLNLDETLTKG